MVPAFELMTQTPRIRELLEEGNTGEIARTIEQGATAGLISFNQALRRLVQQKLIDLKDALAASDRPDELVLALRGITSGTARKRSENSSNAPRHVGPAPTGKNPVAPPNVSHGGPGTTGSSGSSGLRMAGEE